MKDGETKLRLAEMVNAKESLALLSAGDLAGAERPARQSNDISSIIEAYPPLTRRPAEDGTWSAPR